MEYDAKELLSLKGKIAMVTGGAQHLGYDIVAGLLEMGAIVLITSRDLAKVEARAAEFDKKHPGRVFGYELDLASEESVLKLFAAVKERFGRLDVLVNNAVTYAPEATGFLESEPLAPFERCIKVNLTGTFLMMREYARLMIPHKSGCIINFASIASSVGRDRRIYPDGMQPQSIHYAAAKAGVLGLTNDGAAMLGKYGIRVNAISPGGMERNQPQAFIDAFADKTMLGRMGRTETDLKGVVAFLASEAACYITGQNIFVDGGFLKFK